MARGAFFFFFLAAAWAADKPPGYAIASAHPLATEAGMKVLKDGGNAFDAAVAVSAALAVVEPTGSGIGGGGFWLLHREPDDYETMVDGRETAPHAARPDMYLTAAGTPNPLLSRDGPLAAGIPGAPAAWVHIAKKYGRMPLSRLLAPAIRLAQDGFPVDAKLAQALQQNAVRFSPAAAAVFAPGGQPLPAGAPLRQPDLARTLERLAAGGRAGFYAGEVAQKLIAGAHDDGGIWTDDDLRRYRIVERKPIVTFFRDYRIVSAPPPSAGGAALAQVLQMLEVLGWPAQNAALSKHELIEAWRRAYRDRAAWLGDPDFVTLPLHRLVSRDHALALARGISFSAATPSSRLPGPELAREGGQTTHFSVLDAEGNRVAGTLSLNLPFGSAYMPPGTGVLLNDEMDDFAASESASNAYSLIGSKANAIVPGKRMLSSMTPTFVEGPRGLLILGTPGGSRIVTMVLLGILEFTDGLNAAQIVAAPRYHHQYLPDEVQFEPGALTDAEQKALQGMGHTLKPLAYNYGNLQAIWWDTAQNRLEAAADPRGVGAGRVNLTAPEPEPNLRPAIMMNGGGG